MSLEIILIPVAMAAYAAWQARAERSASLCLVETRWRHTGLLELALADIGATDVSVTDEKVAATIDGLSVEFVRGPEAMSAHFSAGADEQAATDLIRGVDSAYTRRVQDAVYRRIRNRVDELGYEIASETVDEDEAITLVVNVTS